MIHLSDISDTVIERILDAGLPNITSANFVQPNKSTGNKSKDLLIEIIVHDNGAWSYSDSHKIKRIRISIILAVPVDTGCDRIRNFASKISDLFSEQAPSKWAYELPSGDVFYVAGLVSSDGYNENDLYRMNVVLDADLYETIRS